jgi:hypothetical protein
MLIPAGGLANRMRAVVSAYNLCRAVGGKMQVVWFRDWALNAPFHDIFRPVDTSLFDLREARGLDFLVNDRPRRRNFWIPKAFQKVVFDARIYEQFVTPLKQTDFDFEAWLRGRRCYMSCYQEFGTFDNALYKKIFRPVDEVMERVETFRESFSGYTIGMHIRRTDNAESIEKSPTSLFIEARAGSPSRPAHIPRHRQRRGETADARRLCRPHHNTFRRRRTRQHGGHTRRTHRHVDALAHPPHIRFGRQQLLHHGVGNRRKRAYCPISSGIMKTE